MSHKLVPKICEYIYEPGWKTEVSTFRIQKGTWRLRGQVPLVLQKVKANCPVNKDPSKDLRPLTTCTASAMAAVRAGCGHVS